MSPWLIHVHLILPEIPWADLIMSVSSCLSKSHALIYLTSVRELNRTGEQHITSQSKTWGMLRHCDVELVGDYWPPSSGAETVSQQQLLPSTHVCAVQQPMAQLPNVQVLTLGLIHAANLRCHHKLWCRHLSVCTLSVIDTWWNSHG